MRWMAPVGSETSCSSPSFSSESSSATNFSNCSGLPLHSIDQRPAHQSYLLTWRGCEAAYPTWSALRRQYGWGTETDKGPSAAHARAMLSRDDYERTDYTRVDVADGIQLRAIRARALTAATTTKKMPGLLDTVFA